MAITAIGDRNFRYLLATPIVTPFLVGIVDEVVLWLLRVEPAASQAQLQHGHAATLTGMPELSGQLLGGNQVAIGAQGSGNLRE